MAAYLDPNTYRFLTNDERESVEKELTKLFPVRSTRSNNQTQNEITQPIEEPKNLYDNFGNKCNYVEYQTVNPKKKTIKDEISFYITSLNGEIEFGKFWSEKSSSLPLLSTVVRKTNQICASSVPSESAFSIAGYVNRKERSALSSNNLRFSMLLRDSHIIDNILKNKTND